MPSKPMGLEKPLLVMFDNGDGITTHIWPRKDAISKPGCYWCELEKNIQERTATMSEIWTQQPDGSYVASIPIPAYALAAARREGMEEAAKICDFGVKWEPALNDESPEFASKETAYLLAKAIRAAIEQE